MQTNQLKQNTQMKHAKKITAVLFVAVTAMMYSCGGGKTIEGEKLDWSQIKDKSMEGKMVTIEGYVELPFLMYTDAGKSTLNMHERMNQYSGGMIQLSVMDGSGENTMKELPDSYEQSDIELHDNSGGTIHYGEKVRITGKAVWADTKLKIEVEMIEKATETYDYAKESVRFTDSSDFEALNDKMVWLEGEIYIADEQESGVRLDTWVDDSTLSVEVYCKLEYGSLASQADELPESYTEDDFIFRDAKGKKCGEGSRVRVYGVYDSDKDMVAVEKIESAE